MEIFIIQSTCLPSVNNHGEKTFSVCVTLGRHYILITTDVLRMDFCQYCWHKESSKFCLPFRRLRRTYLDSQKWRELLPRWSLWRRNPLWKSTNRSGSRRQGLRGALCGIAGSPSGFPTATMRILLIRFPRRDLEEINWDFIFSLCFLLYQVFVG